MLLRLSSVLSIQKNSSSIQRPTAGAFFRAEEAQGLLGDNESSSRYSCLSETDTVATDDSLDLPLISWKSTDRHSFYRNQPLVAAPNPNDTTDQDAALRKALRRSRKLPCSTGNFGSNHVMVNVSRRKRMVAPVFRLAELDQLARVHAQAMAQAASLFHSDATQLAQSHAAHIMGENVARGKTIRDIHVTMLHDPTQAVNILHRRYTHMGMGTAKSSDGTLYLCQIFRG